MPVGERIAERFEAALSAHRTWLHASPGRQCCFTLCAGAGISSATSRDRRAKAVSRRRLSRTRIVAVLPSDATSSALYFGGFPLGQGLSPRRVIQRPISADRNSGQVIQKVGDTSQRGRAGWPGSSRCTRCSVGFRGRKTRWRDSASTRRPVVPPGQPVNLSLRSVPMILLPNRAGRRRRREVRPPFRHRYCRVNGPNRRGVQSRGMGDPLGPGFHPYRGRDGLRFRRNRFRPIGSRRRVRPAPTPSYRAARRSRCPTWRHSVRLHGVLMATRPFHASTVSVTPPASIVSARPYRSRECIPSLASRQILQSRPSMFVTASPGVFPSAR